MLFMMNLLLQQRSRLTVHVRCNDRDSMDFDLLGGASEFLNYAAPERSPAMAAARSRNAV
jgi:hypothetical protein